MERNVHMQHSAAFTTWIDVWWISLCLHRGEKHINPNETILLNRTHRFRRTMHELISNEQANTHTHIRGGDHHEPNERERIKCNYSIRTLRTIELDLVVFGNRLGAARRGSEVHIFQIATKICCECAAHRTAVGTSLVCMKFPLA